MRFVIADTFNRSLDKLDSQSQNLIKQTAFDMQRDPKSSGLQLHRLDRARDKRFWSARVTRDLRLIIHQQPDVFMLCYAGHHDDAYDWAENRKLDVHPDTGAPLFVEVEERIEEIVRMVVHEESIKPPLFAEYDPEYLRKLGVPPQWLDALKYVTEDSIDELDERIPQEALERLYDLAAGTPVPVPVSELVTDPLNHPDAGRRFRVMTDSEELQAALNSPWEKWLVFLHPRQRKAVESNYNGPAKVVGGAGTGKTVVALHRATRLAKENPKSRILLTTFSSTLAKRLSRSLDLLSGDQCTWRQSIEVTHVHKLFSDAWRQQEGVLKIVSEAQINAALETAFSRSPGQETDMSFFRSEWRLIIDPNGIDNWNEYRSVSRQGRGTPLGLRQRMKVWSVFEQVIKEVKASGQMTWSSLSKWVAENNVIEHYDHAVVDEAQDLGQMELSALRSLVKPGRNDLYFCSDAGQQIYRVPFVWNSLGIDIRGRSSRLRVNYRTTSQIKSFSEQVLPDSTKDEGSDESRNVISLMSGPEPEIYHCDTVAHEREVLGELLQDLISKGLLPDEVALFARTDDYLRKVARKAIRGLGLEYKNLSDDSDDESEKFLCGTMHRAKGLEYRVVILLGCSEGLVPLQAAINSASDEVESEDLLRQEAHLLYVACSRARERLIILSSGEPSRFLPDK